MIYDPSNAAGAQVYEVETKRQLTCVLIVDTERGEVHRAVEPLRANIYQTDIEKVVERFTTIHPIRGRGLAPALFHCYGRLR